MTRKKLGNFMRVSGFTRLMIGVLLSCLGATPALAQVGKSACGPITNATGPFDYRTDRDKLPIVVGSHFTPEVEALIRGTTNHRPGADIDYTLRAIPNNHRALLAMMRLGEKEKTPQPSGSRYSVECWFDRAVRFRPDDGVVRMIYSSYLYSKGRVQEANHQLETATSYAKDSAITHYNIGLHYFDMKNYGKAIVQAHKAIELGFPQTSLRDQLQAIGKWTEPAIAPTTPASGIAPAQ